MTAPTLDSVVRAWYDGERHRADTRKVQLQSRVQYRPIPAVGNSRKVQTKERYATKWIEAQNEMVLHVTLAGVAGRAMGRRSFGTTLATSRASSAQESGACCQ